MHLVALAQPAQDRDRVLDRRLVHGQRLEPPLERRVLFDVLAVLGESGRPDAVQLTAGEHRLQHVARVHRALRRTGPHDGVQLVDEHDDPALRALDLREHGLEALLELAAVLRARDQQAQVEREDRLVLQPLGDVAAHDALGEALHDRGLADARVADQDRVVLRLARQDLDHAADLGVAADHRIHLPGARLRDQVAPVLLERLVGDLRVRAGDSLVAAHLGQDLEEALARHAMLLQQPPGGGLRAGLDHREQHVLDGHVLVLQPVGLPLGRVQQLPKRARDVHLAGLGAGAADARAAFEVLLDRGPQRGDAHVHSREQARDQALGLLEEREQQVLDVDLGVPVAHRLRLGVVQRLLCLLGQLVRIHAFTSSGGSVTRSGAAALLVWRFARKLARNRRPRQAPPPGAGLKRPRRRPDTGGATGSPSRREGSASRRTGTGPWGLRTRAPGPSARSAA